MRRDVHGFLAILGLLVGVVLPSCAPDYEPIDPRQVRAFQVPIGDRSRPADSTLCLLSVPEGYAPDEARPLVVALHGYGSGAAPFHDLWRRVTASSGYVLVTPQGEQPTREGIGWSWGPHAEEVIRRSVDGARQIARVDASRIFLVGFSQGGRLAYSVGLKYAGAFRGIAPLGAPLDPLYLPDADKAHLLRGLRVYIGRGEMEPDPEGARAAADTLRTLGCEVRLVEYPGIGHRLPDPIEVELEAILDFLGSHRGPRGA